MYRAIIFDCFGVLTTDTWKAFVENLPPEVDRVRLKEINRQLDAGMLERDEFKRQVYELSGSTPQDVETLLDNETVKNEKLFHRIGELRRGGLKIGLLSNVSTNWIRDYFLTLDEQALFDSMVMSFEVRMTKPDPRIFELACDRLGVKIGDTILVDDVEQNCLAAEEVGMKAICYKEFDDFQKELNQYL